MSRNWLPGPGNRFLAAVLGAVLASLVWTVVVTYLATTPGQARRERSAPHLPPPSATVVRTRLRQVSWHQCTRDRQTTEIYAPPVSAEFRPAVIRVAKSGSKIDTGSLLAQVADAPIIAVETDGVLYRDLVVGDRGSDVQAFEHALKRVGLISNPDSVLDPETVSSWRRAIDHSGPPDRVRLATLVTVGPGSKVAAVMVGVGDLADTKSPVMEVQRASQTFRCEVPDPPIGLTRDEVDFKSGSTDVEVDDIAVHSRTAAGAGGVDVLPQGKPASDQGQLGIVASDSEGSVLAVPLSAIKISSSGHQSVVVVSGLSRHVVSVSLGVSAQGLVEVAGEGLREGAHVELFDQARTSSAAAAANPESDAATG